MHTLQGVTGGTVHFQIESEKEDDGRWIAEVPEIPGVLTYGENAEDAMAKAEVLALRVLAEKTGADKVILIA